MTEAYLFRDNALRAARRRKFSSMSGVSWAR